MKTTPALPFRVYVMKELAIMYFPDERADLACRHLRLLIRKDPLLQADLTALGIRPRQRLIPPSAVEVLLRHLGTPEEFYALAHEG